MHHGSVSGDSGERKVVSALEVMDANANAIRAEDEDDSANNSEAEDEDDSANNSEAEDEDEEDSANNSEAEAEAEAEAGENSDADASSPVSAGHYLLDDFKSDVRTWIELDDSIKTLQHAIRDRRLAKQKLTQRIIGFMDHHDIEDLNTKSGRIRYKTNLVRPPVSKTKIKDRISSFFPNDAQVAEDIVSAIYASSEVTERQSLRRLK
jgi:hypothetical protein